mgnify:CR=1 FL=1
MGSSAYVNAIILDIHVFHYRTHLPPTLYIVLIIVKVKIIWISENFNE